MKAAFTFGITVYNVERYIEQCVKSVSALKGDDIEIIVVDDGSDDYSGDICDKCALEDCRIRVVHNRENRGASAARNLIIEQAQGEWITFVDGDDMLTSDALEQFRRVIDKKYDIIYFNRVPFRTSETIVVPAPYADSSVCGDEVKNVRLETLYHLDTCRDYPCNSLRPACAKLYSREFLIENNLRMCEQLRHSQDAIFNITCLNLCKNLCFAGQYIYLYRQSATSTAHRFSPNLPDMMGEFSKMTAEMENGDPDFTKRHYLRDITDIRICLRQYYCHKHHPASFPQRETAFKKFMAREWCTAAVANADKSMLTAEDRAVFSALKDIDFHALDKYCKRRAKEKSGIVTAIGKLFGRKGNK